MTTPEAPAQLSLLKVAATPDLVFRIPCMSVSCCSFAGVIKYTQSNAKNLTSAIWQLMGSPPASSYRQMLAFGFAFLKLQLHGIIPYVLFGIWHFHWILCPWALFCVHGSFPFPCYVVVHCLNRPQFASSPYLWRWTFLPVSSILSTTAMNILVYVFW